MTSIKIRDFDGNETDIDLQTGDVLFIAGKNGSGKSTLCLEWAKKNPENPILMGNREVSFMSSAVNTAPSEIQRQHEHAKNLIAHHASARTDRAEHNNQNWLSLTLGQLDSLRIHYLDKRVQALEAGSSDDAQKNETKRPSCSNKPSIRKHRPKDISFR